MEIKPTAPRQCDECGKGMHEGYCIDGGAEYYCSDTCLHKHYTPEQWNEMYDDDGDTYWTTWEEDTEMMEIKPTELTQDNPGVLIKVNGTYVLADDYIALMDRHNMWGSEAYKRESARVIELENVIYNILNMIPFDLLKAEFERRNEEDK